MGPVIPGSRVSERHRIGGPLFDLGQPCGGLPRDEDRLAALSINSSHRIANATHDGLLDDPHGAAVSVRAITDVVRSASTRASLTRP